MLADVADVAYVANDAVAATNETDAKLDEIADDANEDDTDEYTYDADTDTLDEMDIVATADTSAFNA